MKVSTRSFSYLKASGIEDRSYESFIEHHETLRYESLVISDRLGFLQKLWELVLLSLQLRVSTNVILVDEDIRYRSLARDFFERILKGTAVICNDVSNTIVDVQVGSSCGSLRIVCNSPT